MIVTMQGNWTVSVHSKSAMYDQRFTISGTGTAADGTYPGVFGSPPVNVTVIPGTQWSIAIQNNPGTGWQLSDTHIEFPNVVGSDYVFKIRSNDAGSDSDFNDLILSCSTPVNINEFIIYGTVSLYSGLCNIFNPCRYRHYYVIDTREGLEAAIRNKVIRAFLEKYYPERVREIIVDPNPPDPLPFKPIVIDLSGEFAEPKKSLIYKRIENVESKASAKAKKETLGSTYYRSNYTLVKSAQQKSLLSENFEIGQRAELARAIEALPHHLCHIERASNITLTFEEYDRTLEEKTSWPPIYTGLGDRRALGDTVTDVNGNYIFRFYFDMQFPGIEDSSDIATGELMDVVAYPDVIVKVTGFAPYNVLYESEPKNNLPNLTRINLCLPKSLIPQTNACFNGNLIGSLGNVHIGGSQNVLAHTTDAALQRYGDGNFLEADGKITVGSPMALFSVQCAAWTGIIDLKGCMYDTSNPANQNIKWYTIRIRRAEPGYSWVFVSQNYKHPRFCHRNLPGYIGDDVGPFTTSLEVDGGPSMDVPAYINIQREIFHEGIDWEFPDCDRFMQLNTRLYDLISGVRTPGTFYVRVDGYNETGQLISNVVDLIALYIHNLPLQFELTSPGFESPLSPIIYSGCDLYRIPADGTQMNRPIKFAFKANDPYGFVDNFKLTISRCPEMIDLLIKNPSTGLWGFWDYSAHGSTFFSGNASGNTQTLDCPGYTGTIDLFGDSGMIDVELKPAVYADGWIKATEYFTRLTFILTAQKRETNGYNTGVSSTYYRSAGILMERMS